MNGEHLDAVADPRHPRCANKHGPDVAARDGVAATVGHGQIGLERVELTSVAVALDVDIDRSERTLVRSATTDAIGQQDHAGAGPEDGHPVTDTIGDRLEQSGRFDEFGHRRRFTAGDHQSVDEVELGGVPNRPCRYTGALERTLMGGKCPLKCQYTDVHTGQVNQPVTPLRPAPSRFRRRVPMARERSLLASPGRRHRARARSPSGWVYRRVVQIRRSLLGLLLLTVSVIVTIASIPDRAVSAASYASVDCTIKGGVLPAEAKPATSYLAQSPRRLIDTRFGTGGVTGPVNGGCSLRIDLNAAGIARSSALALSLTTIADELGFLTAFPCAAGPGATSNVNPRRNATPAPNLVVVRPDAYNHVCVYTDNPSQMIVDLVGRWSTSGGGRFAPIPPTRMYDSRTIGSGAPVPARNRVTIDVSAVVPTEATAVVANITASQTEGPGHVSAWPCDTPIAEGSNLNYVQGEARAVSAIIGVNAKHQICLESFATAHLIVDISGYYAETWGTAPGLVSIPGHRVADSRTPSGQLTQKVGADQVVRVRPLDGVSVPGKPVAVVLNLTTTQSDNPGHLTAYSCDAARPLVSNLNYTPFDQASNAAIVELSAKGEVCIHSFASTALVVDLMGVFTLPSDVPALSLSLDTTAWPPFDPGGQHYATSCPATGTARLSFRVTVPTGTTAKVDGVDASKGTVTVAAKTNSLIPITFSGRSGEKTYFLRCLPADYPELDVVKTGETEDGWYVTSIDGKSNSYLSIFDSYGGLAWYKSVPLGGTDFQRISGTEFAYIVASARFGSDPKNKWRITNLDGALLKRWGTIADPDEPEVVFPTDHHEIAKGPGNGYTAISYPLLLNQDLTVLERKFGGEAAPNQGPSHFYADDNIVDGVLQEIAADGSLSWSWRASEHFSYDEVTFPNGRNYVYTDIGLPHGGEVDVWHLNAFQRQPNGDYFFTSRHMDSVFYVQRSTGDVKWILSGNSNHGANPDGATYLEVKGDPFGGPLRPHHGRLNGNVLTVFDNRAQTNQPARAVAYKIDVEAGTATMLWQLPRTDGQFSFGLGNTTVLDNGGVLVNWGGGLEPMFTEFSAAREPVLDVTQPGAGRTYRVYKEPPAAFSPAQLRAKAGGVAKQP